MPNLESAPVPFQPTPYEPSAKIPTASTPHAPQTPCTETAPTGSSTPRFSKNHTDSTTMRPAMRPMTAAAHGCTNAHGAVIATSPASMPFAIIPGSGWCALARICTQNIATTAPNAAAIAVFTATTANRLSVAAKRRRGVEAEPTEQQDERAEHRHRDVVPGEHASVSRRARTCRFVDRGSSRRPGRRRRPSCARRRNRRSRRSRDPCSRVSPSLASQPPPHVHAPNSG